MQFDRAHLYAVLRHLREKVEATMAETSEVHAFSARFLAAIGADIGAFHTYIGKCYVALEHSMQATAFNTATTRPVPKLTHKVWMTSATAPSLPPDDYVDDYLIGLRSLPTGWTHYFWSNSDAVVEHIRGKARDHGVSVLASNVELLSDDALYPVLTAFATDRKFVLAADIVKIMLLGRLGGVYSDLGINFRAEVLELVGIADYCFLLGTNGFFQTSFVACAPGSDVMLAFAAVALSPEILDPAYALAGGDLSGLDEVNILAGPGFTATALMFLPPTARTLIMPPQSDILIWRSQSSWYGTEGKHGNTLVQTAPPSRLRLEVYAEHTARVTDSLKIYGKIGLMQERLKFLVRAKPYFDTVSTRLCEILRFHGSDKAKSWHNYSFVYNYMLGHLVAANPTVLEIGIGTNHTDVPSTMGVTGVPGASLRAWREYFRGGAIAGADVDRRILFSDANIKTYFVDQLDVNTIQNMLSDMGNPQFDLIIDDGLHTYEANINVLKNTFGALKSGGLMLIEDIMVDTVERWDSFLNSAGYNAVMLTLPHDRNMLDNRVLAILKP